MLITLRVPDDTAVLKYAKADETGYILSDVPVTAGMIVEVKRDDEESADARISAARIFRREDPKEEATSAHAQTRPGEKIAL